MCPNCPCFYTSYVRPPRYSDLMNERETMNYEETQKIDEAILNYALIKSGDERYKYAFAYGMVFAILTEDQKNYLKKYALNGVSQG